MKRDQVLKTLNDQKDELAGFKVKYLAIFGSVACGEKKGMSRSNIIRLALLNYVEREKRWQRIYEIGEKKAKELGIRSEEDIERLIHEFRKDVVLWKR